MCRVQVENAQTLAPEIKPSALQRVEAFRLELVMLK